VQNASLWRALLGVENTVVEDVEFDEEAQVLVALVRPRRASRGRCGTCGSRASWYDRGQGRRRWRGLDMGTIQVFVEADAPRVNCPVHGPTVRQVPWARHGAGHTRCFDQQVAWLATQCSKTAITELMRIAWRTVASIITRVWADTAADIDAFAGLRRIGIDEISYKRHHKYLTVVVDHDSGRLVWASPGHERATVRAFFDALEASGQGRCAQITHVTADGAEWIADVVCDRCPDAIRCADPFHVVGWATEALDAVRREAWNAARRGGHTRNHGWAHGRRATVSTGPALALRRARYALWKNPENLTDRQRVKLEWIAKTDPRLYRAYLLKEGLRSVFKLPVDQAADTATSHRWPPRADPRLHRPRPIQWAHRVGQHQDPTHHPHRLRLRKPRPPHRPGNAHPRRTPPNPPRPTMTHGSVRRASFDDALRSEHALAL
jgi:transposase